MRSAASTKLLLQSGGGASAIAITSGGNVGIGTNNPQAFLDITYSSPTLPENKDMLNIKTDGNWGLKVQQSSSSGNIHYNFIHRYLSVDYNSLTFKGANVGIGTSTPTYRMHIKTVYDTINTGLTLDASETNSTDTYLLTIYGYVVGGGMVGWRFRVKSISGGDNTAIQISNTGSVYFPIGSSSASDSRIKKDIEDINDESALNKLLLIQPTTYNYIDVERNKGFGKVYGFIAQQIREVIPEAITIIVKEVIPNIYKRCLINNKREVYHSIPLDTPIDTSVKIDDTLYKIKELHEDYFVIDKDIDTDDAFVFGYSVDDFHTLDKTYIFTLNVCATQELHRRIEAQSVLLKTQDDRIKDLETKVATLMSNM